MFAAAPGYTHPFDTLHRIKLLYSAIESKNQLSCALNLTELAEAGSILAFYPLHNHSKIRHLEHNWLHYRNLPWLQPNDAIRAYLGEQLSLYFRFVAHFSTWLVPLGVVGAVVTIHLIILVTFYPALVDTVRHMYSVPPMCVFVCLWTTW